MYYSRKLNLYNLSIYEFKPPQNDARCMIWTEINGKRGSVEIASAIHLWIKNLDPRGFNARHHLFRHVLGTKPKSVHSSIFIVLSTYA